MQIMQRRCVFARAEDAGVGLLLGAEGEAALREDGGEVLLVGRGAGLYFGEDGGVGGGGDGVGVAEEGELVGVFGYAADVDCAV